MLKLKEKKKKPFKSSYAIANILATLNNTFITIIDTNGHTFIQKSTGNVGFKKAKRSTTYAAQTLGTSVGKLLLKENIESLQVNLKGIGKGREPVVRSLRATGLIITQIVDQTYLPHNGCRPKKKRRL